MTKVRKGEAGSMCEKGSVNQGSLCREGWCSRVECGTGEGGYVAVCRYFVRAGLERWVVKADVGMPPH